MQKFLENLKRWGSLNPRQKEPSPYGDMMERTVAWTIDLALLYTLLSPLFDLLAMQVYRHGELASIDAVKRANFAQVYRDGNVALSAGDWSPLLGSPALVLYLTDLITAFILLGVLVVGAQCIYGSTPGKWLLGLKIVKRTSLEPIARWRYVLRYLAYIPSVGMLMLGVIWSHFNRERRTLHDLIAGTVVIQTRPNGWYWGKVKQGFGWAKGKLVGGQSSTPAE